MLCHCSCFPPAFTKSQVSRWEMGEQLDSKSLFSFWDLQLSLFLKLNSQIKKKWGDSNQHVKEMNKHNQTVKYEICEIKERTLGLVLEFY